MGARNMLCQFPRPISRGLPGSFAFASSAFLKRPAFSDAVFPRNFVSHCPLAARPFSLARSFSISSPGPVPISNPGDVDPSVQGVDCLSESKAPRPALPSSAVQKTKHRQKSKARKQTRTRNRTTKRARPASPVTNKAKVKKRGKCVCRRPNKKSPFKGSKSKAPCKASKSRCCCCCHRANRPRTKGNQRRHRHVAKKARHKSCKRSARRHRRGRGHSTVKRRSKRLTAKDVQEGLFAPLLGSLDDPEREEAANARTINPYRMYKEFIRRSISSGTTAFLPSPAWLGRTRSAAPSVGRHVMARMRWLGKRKASEGGERATRADATRSAPARAKGKVVKRSPPSSRGGSARPRKDSAIAQLSVTPSPGAGPGLCPGPGLCSCPGSGLCVDPDLCASPGLCTAQGKCTCSGSGLSICPAPGLSTCSGPNLSAGAGAGASLGAGSGVSVGPGPGVGAASASGSSVAPAPGSGLTQMERLRLWSPVVRRITLVARPDTSPASARLHH